MSQDPKIMSAALSRFQADRDARRNALEARRREVYRRAPRVEMIDRELTGTAARVIAAAFQQGGDPDAALKDLEKRNLALQRERSELLVGAGFPYDYIDETPQCPICSDRGWRKDDTPCRCLMAYYTREQNRRLSKILDLGNQSFDTFSFDWYSPEQ